MRIVIIQLIAVILVTFPISGLQSIPANYARSNSSLPSSEANITAIEWSADGTKLAIGDDVGFVQIIETTIGEAVSTIQAGDLIGAIVWHPTNNNLLAISSFSYASENSTVAIYDVRNGQIVLTIPIEAVDIPLLDWSPDDTRLVGVTGFIADLLLFRDILVWDVSNGQIIVEARYIDNNVNALAWSPDGNLIATTALNDVITIWDAATLAVVTELTTDVGTISSLDWSPDGTKIASSINYFDKSIRIWEIASGQETLVIPNVDAFEIDWSPDGRGIAAAVSGVELPIFDAATGEVSMSINQGSTSRSIAWSPDRGQLAFGIVSNEISIVHLPVAEVGGDQTLTDSDNNGAELVTLDGSASAHQAKLRYG